MERKYGALRFVGTVYKVVGIVIVLVVLLAACGGTPSVATSTPIATVTPTATVPTIEAATMTPTPTPTAWPVVPPATPTPAVASRCQGLAGTLEVQVVVGPAEAVGLEPVAVGQVPFAVTTEQAPYLLQGQAPIAYEATLEKEWGTYTVNMNLDMAVSGECTGQEGSESLDVVLDMNGDQLVVVDAEGFHGEYPWSGAHTLNLSFPLQEGATAQGEGWVVVLHLGA